MVAVTRHAKRRLKERCGVNKNSAQKMAERAFENGISFENAGEILRKYISSIYLKHDKMCNNIRIYGNTVYIFDNQTLITVYLIPQEILQEMDTLADSIDEVADKEYCNYSKGKFVTKKELKANTQDEFIVQSIQIDRIKIPKNIRCTPPNKKTMQRHRDYFISTGKIRKPITIGLDNYLIDGYCDYLLAKENQYDLIHCVIPDVYGNIPNRTNARKELYEKHGGKCGFCDRKISFKDTSMIYSGGVGYCICPKCIIQYSIAMNPQSYRKIEKGIDFAGIKQEIVSYFEKRNAIIEKVSLLNGTDGQYISVKFDYVDENVTADCFKDLSDRYNIRICSPQIKKTSVPKALD